MYNNCILWIAIFDNCASRSLSPTHSINGGRERMRQTVNTPDDCHNDQVSFCACVYPYVQAANIVHLCFHSFFFISLYFSRCIFLLLYKKMCGCCWREIWKQTHYYYNVEIGIDAARQVAQKFINNSHNRTEIDISNYLLTWETNNTTTKNRALNCPVWGAPSFAHNKFRDINS